MYQIYIVLMLSAHLYVSWIPFKLDELLQDGSQQMTVKQLQVWAVWHSMSKSSGSAHMSPTLRRTFS